MKPGTLFDMRGHFGMGRIGPRTAGRLPKGLSYMAVRLTSSLRIDEELAKIVPPVEGLPSALVLQTEECGCCGRSVRFAADGRTVSATTACDYPDGFPIFEVSIDVPSGRIVFANDMRDLARPGGVDASWNVNRTPEMARCTRDYAAEGLVHVFVGNTCPGVLSMPDGSIAVSQSNKRGGRLAGNVCTDLWWFSAMDEDEFHARCRDAGVAPETYAPFTVTVEPGEWAFSVDYGGNRDARGFVFSRGRRIGPCTGRTRPSDPFADGGPQEGGHLRAFTGRLRRSGYLSFLDTCLEYCFCSLGNGLGWNLGRVSHHKAQEAWAGPGDPRIRSWAGSPEEACVPPLPMPSYGGARSKDDLFDLTGDKGTRRAYPMSDEPFRPLAARIPGDADPRWLAAALMLFRAMSMRPEVLSDRSPKETAEQVRIVRDTLDLLLSLAEERGGTQALAPMFEEILAMDREGRGEPA